MAKRTADEFFSSSKPNEEGKIKKTSAEDFFNRTKEEMDNSRSKDVLDTTLKSVIRTDVQKVEPPKLELKKEIDFMAEVAKSKAAPKQESKLQGKLPASSLLVGNDTKVLQNNLQGKLPAVSLLSSTGGGPANAADIPGVSQYEINKKEIAKAPPVVKQYAQAMNYLTEGNPIGIAVGNAFSGNSGATLKDSSGNKTVDKVADAINNFVTPILTPTGAPLGQGIIGSSYEGVGNALKSAAGQKAINTIATGVPFAGQTAARNITRVGLTEGIAGAMQGVGIGLQQGDDSGRDVVRNAIMGGAGGALLGTAGSAAGEGLSKLASMFRKSGVPENEIAELLALPEANPRTIRKQLAGEIKTAAGTEPISTPYTFKLGEATPETQVANISRQGANKSAVNVIDPIADTKYQQSVIDEYKRLKNDPNTNLSYKETYELAAKNMESKKPTNPIVETKLKDTRINGESTYKEPVIRNPKELTREQEVNNRVLSGGELSQQDIDFLLSPEYNPKNLYPDSTPTKSTYVKPKAEVISSVKEEVAATVETDLKPVAKRTIVTEVKKPSNSSTNPEKKTAGIRANFKTMSDSGNISAKLKGKIGELDQRYEVSKNANVVKNSNEAIKDLSATENKFLLNESGGAQHISDGYRVMQELDKAGEHARALTIADKLAKDLTKAGQTTQAASLIQRLSPEGQLLNLIRTADKNGKVVDVADSVKFKKLAEKVQDNSGAGKAENAISDILNRLEEGGASADDIKALGDYLKNAESKIKPKVVKDKLPKELNNPRKREKVISFLEEAEAAAQKRIDKRRGRLNSLPVEEWIDYSILIAAKVGKGAIKAETHIEDLVKLFGEEIKPIATQVFEKAQQLVAGVTKSTVEGDFLRANDAFKRITGQVKATKQERIVEKYIMENPKVNAKDIDSLRKLSKSLTELQGTDKIKADMAMQKILNSYEKSSPMDKINALRYIAMLYNSGTQLINAASGPIMATTGRTADVFGSMIDSVLRTAMKQPRTTTLYGGNPVKFMAEYMKGLKIGAKAGWEGVNPAGIQGANEIRGLTYKSLYNPLSLLERSLGSVAKGADYAAYSAIFKGEMEKQGFLNALESGLKRGNKDAIKNHVRKFVNDPPVESVEQADRIAKNATFQRNDTFGGKAANFLNSAPPLVKPAVNAVFPFVRTPLNIASTAFTMSPGGIIKGLIQLSSKSAVGQREAIRTLSLGITGTGLSAVGYYLNQIGVITGSNDSGDKNVNSIREQAGKGKYRFNTSALSRYVGALLDGKGADAAEAAAKYQKGDKQFDYNKLQPLAFPLSIGAEFKELKGKPADKRLMGTLSGAGGSLFGMSTLRGVQDVFQPQYGGTQGEKAGGVVTRLAESFFKSFSPSMLAQEARRQDPVQRKTPYNDGLVTDVKGYFKSRTPGLSKDLPANKDTLGQSKKNAPGVMGQYVNPYKSEVANYTQAAAFIVELMERTGDTSIAPKPPEKTVRGKDENDISVSLTIPTKRYEKLQEDIGNEIINRVMEIEAGSDEELITQLEDIYSEVRKEYMDEVKEELGLQVK